MLCSSFRAHLGAKVLHMNEKLQGVYFHAGVAKNIGFYGFLQFCNIVNTAVLAFDSILSCFCSLLCCTFLFFGNPSYGHVG